VLRASVGHAVPVTQSYDRAYITV